MPRLEIYNTTSEVEEDAEVTMGTRGYWRLMWIGSAMARSMAPLTRDKLDVWSSGCTQRRTDARRNRKSKRQRDSRKVGSKGGR